MIKKNILLSVFILLSIAVTQGQHITKSKKLNIEISDRLQQKIYSALDSLYLGITNKKIDPKYISTQNSMLSLSMFSSLQKTELNKEYNNPNFYQKQLINCYSIGRNQYLLSIAYIGNKEGAFPELKMIYNFIAEENNTSIQFSTPLTYLTKTWKSKTIGDIKYIYRDSLNVSRAKLFNSKNKIIANKLGLTPERFTFYICKNYQEILKLLGFEYDMDANGKTRDGYGVDASTIFSILENEDFSHDIFHYYSAKINARKNRNWIAEEGIAYSWGNAYYTNTNDEMVDQKFLVQKLKTYLSKKPNTSLLSLFKNNPPIFQDIAPEIAVRSILSGLICDEIEKQKGAAGIQKIINCGRKSKMENYLKTTNELIGINTDNFDTKVSELIKQYP